MRRPWNIVNQPVYSLATYLEGTVNMNICTYVTPISMKPKQYAIAVYHNTCTLKRLEQSAKAVLQLLTVDHVSLIKKLGKTSGFALDKDNWLRTSEYLYNWRSYEVLKGAAAYIELEKVNVTDSGGDHALYVFKASGYSTIKEDNILHLQDLVEQKVIL